MLIKEEDLATVRLLVENAKKAMVDIENYSQAEIDLIVKAVAWSIYEDNRAKELAEVAVKDTGLGNVADKIAKNQRKTLGTLNDLLSVKTIGVVEECLESGLIKYSKPVGVVGTLIPSTNPAATPANQAMMAVKGGNAIIVSPSPAGWQTAKLLETFIKKELKKINAPTNLFQVMPGKPSFSKAQALMELCDLVVVTGDQKNVKKGYSSGTPCIGVGKGNVPVIIDSSADLNDAVSKIASSKVFDNGTSCSSESSIIVHENVYDAFLAILSKHGGQICNVEEVEKLEKTVYKNGYVNRDVVGQEFKKLAKIANITPQPDGRFFVAEQNGIGEKHPLSGEKLSLVLAVYKANNLDECIETCKSILDYEGIGHSVGVHCNDINMGRSIAEQVKVARVLYNQAHTFGNGGGFNNSLPFTLSMGCGTWAGNSISENLSIKNFVNTTTLVLPINKEEIYPELLFSEFKKQSH